MRGPAATRRLRRQASCRWSIRFGLLQHGTLFRKVSASREILLSIKENRSIDKRHIHTCIDAERMFIPDRDVGILANLNRTHAILNTELYRRIECYEFERLFFGE